MALLVFISMHQGLDKLEYADNILSTVRTIWKKEKDKKGLQVFYS